MLTTSLSNYDYLTAPARELRPPSRRSYRDMDVDHSRAIAALSYGLAARVDITASLPYDRLYQNAGDLAGYVNGQPHVGRLNEYGFGNPRVSAKARFLESASNTMSATLFVEPGIADDEKTSTGATNVGAGLQWQRGRLLLAAAYLSTGEREAGNGAGAFDIADELTLEAGIAIPLRSGRTHFISEVSGTLFSGGTSDPAERLFIVNGFRRFSRNREWSLDAGLRINLTMINSGNNSHPIGGVLTLSYAPR